jgi:hypothetical protein
MGASFNTVYTPAASGSRPSSGGDEPLAERRRDELLPPVSIVGEAAVRRAFLALFGCALALVGHVSAPLAKQVRPLPPPDVPVHVGGDIFPPVKTHHVEPAYPGIRSDCETRGALSSRSIRKARS